ncbi:MAG: cytochrome ubiquinol oxidase subunit I [Desulfobulbaceae bacterium]|nr:cytochrome ubiquinol oxidase subunit I [Desulfobulbaceae bacterium]
MNYPIWQLDSFGGGLLIVLIAVFHVYISHFAVGGGLFLVLAERKGSRENNPAIIEYTRKHARFFLLITMIAGSMTGVGIWFIISLLNPAATSILIHTFVFGWATEWVFFLIEIVSLFIYYYTFGRMERGRHQLIGWIYFGAAWMSLFIINGIIGFMLTPGTWPTDGNFWSGFFNPTFWPSLFFRTFFALIIAGLFGLMTAAWIKEAQLRTTMVRFCARWLLLPFVFFVGSAFWYKAALPDELQTMIFTRMPSMRIFVNGFLLISPLLLLGGLLLAIRLPARLSKTLAVVLLLIGQLYMGCFEFIREGGRRPYIIRDVMYSTSILKKDLPRLQDEGVLRTARWVRNREITAANRLEAGRELYTLLCLSCHAIDGPMRDIRPLTSPFTPSGLDALLSGMDIFYPAMPPFAGTAEERAALAYYIAYGLNGRQNPEPVALTEKNVEIPVFDPENDVFVLLAWNTLGMQYVSDVDRLFSLFPAGNSLRAQLIRRGETPEIVNAGVALRYRVEGDFAAAEARIPLAGTMTQDEAYFTAESIPLLPYPRSGGFDPYPVVTIEARDNNDVLLATTKVVAPVSTELGCRNCHGGPWRMDGRAGLAEETATNILAVHDRLSATALQRTASTGNPIRCRDCHADPFYQATGDAARLNLSASIHGFHANYLRGKGAEACALCHPSSSTGATRCLRDVHAGAGLDCTSCHGTLEDQALGLLKHETQAGKTRAGLLMTHLPPQAVESVEAIVPRTPWANQPDCLNCHVDFQPPETDTTFNTYTKDEQGLYRNRTDESGRLFCAACHASPHAVYPADNPYGAALDGLQPLQYQKNRLPLGSNRNCAVCHTVEMEDEMHHPNMLRVFRNE